VDDLSSHLDVCTAGTFGDDRLHGDFVCRARLESATLGCRVSWFVRSTYADMLSESFFPKLFHMLGYFV
jgi:hypothetical protein